MKHSLSTDALVSAIVIGYNALLVTIIVRTMHDQDWYVLSITCYSLVPFFFYTCVCATTTASLRQW